MNIITQCYSLISCTCWCKTCKWTNCMSQVLSYKCSMGDNLVIALVRVINYLVRICWVSWIRRRQTLSCWTAHCLPGTWIVAEQGGLFTNTKKVSKCSYDTQYNNVSVSQADTNWKMSLAAHANNPHLYMKAEPVLITEHYYYKSPFGPHHSPMVYVDIPVDTFALNCPMNVVQSAIAAFILVGISTMLPPRICSTPLSQTSLIV